MDRLKTANNYGSAEARSQGVRAVGGVPAYPRRGKSAGWQRNPPESYAIAEAVLKRAGLSVHAPAEQRQVLLERLRKEKTVEKISEELGAGVPTLMDIFEQLVRPGRDPREDMPLPILRNDVLKMEDLSTGMCLKGTVRNVVDFGAFVDIGVKQDGLLHRSQVPPGTNLQVGEIIDVEIQKVEPERGRISLKWPGQGER